MCNECDVERVSALGVCTGCVHWVCALDVCTGVCNGCVHDCTFVCTGCVLKVRVAPPRPPSPPSPALPATAPPHPHTENTTKTPATVCTHQPLTHRKTQRKHQPQPLVPQALSSQSLTCGSSPPSPASMPCMPHSSSALGSASQTIPTCRRGCGRCGSWRCQGRCCRWGART